MHIAQTEIHMGDFVIFHSRIRKCGCVNRCNLCVYVRQDEGLCTLPIFVDYSVSDGFDRSGYPQCQGAQHYFQSTIQLWSVMVNNDGSLITHEISQSVR